MNKKGMELHYIVLFVLAAGILVGGMIAFAKPALKSAEDIFGEKGWLSQTFSKWFSFSKEVEEIEIIDEERIDEGTVVGLNPISYDKMSGSGSEIQKLSYGKGWILYVFVGDALGGATSGYEKIYEKSLATLLSSDEFRGKTIEISGKIYIHTPSQNDFQWFENVIDEKETDTYDTDKDKTITPEELAQIIVANLFEKQKEES